MLSGNRRRTMHSVTPYDCNGHKLVALTSQELFKENKNIDQK